MIRADTCHKRKVKQRQILKPLVTYKRTVQCHRQQCYSTEDCQNQWLATGLLAVVHHLPQSHSDKNSKNTLGNCSCQVNRTGRCVRKQQATRDWLHYKMHTQTNSTAIFQQTSGFPKFSFSTSSKSELLGINSKVLSKVRSHIYQPTTSTQSQSAHPNQRRPEKTTVASSAFLNSLTDTHTPV